MPQPTDDLAKLSFEDILERLSEVVEALEAGDAPLEQSLAIFEQGMKLSRAGAHRLDEAERRIEVLLNHQGELSTAPLASQRGEKE